jgi:hypothetical protein
MCLQYILVRFPPSPPSILLRTMSTGFILLFAYMNTKYIHHIQAYSPFSYATPSHYCLPLEKTCFTIWSSFSKCILMFEGVLPWHFRHVYSHDSIIINPLLFLYHHAPLLSLAYSVLCHIFIYR